MKKIRSPTVIYTIILLLFLYELMTRANISIFSVSKNDFDFHSFIITAKKNKTKEG